MSTYKSSHSGSEIDSRLNQATDSTLGVVKAVAKTSEHTDKVGIDPATGELYSKGMAQATDSVLGAVKAIAKSGEHTEEVAIDASTGKLYSKIGVVSVPQATDSVLGTVKAVDKTSEHNEAVAIEASTGKLYSKVIPGKSAYDVWKDEGNTGSVEDYLKAISAKPVKVLPNGHYGNYNPDTGDYEDSGVDASATVDLQSATVDFTQHSSRENIEPTDTMPTLMGKIKKWFSDLKALAFKDRVDYDVDVDNKPDLKALAFKDKADYSSDIDNTPTLGPLATKAKIDYGSDIDNTPTLGALASKNKVNYSSDVEGTPTLGALASKDKVDYGSDINNVPDLKALAFKDKVNYSTDVEGTPTLGTLASKSMVDYASDIQNKPTKLSDFNNDSGFLNNASVVGVVNDMFVTIDSTQLITSSWVSDGSGFKYVVTVSGMKSTSIAWVSPLNDSEDAWIEAGIRMNGKTMENQFEIYSKKKPSANINITITYKK